MRIAQAGGILYCPTVNKAIGGIIVQVTKMYEKYRGTNISIREIYNAHSSETRDMAFHS